MKKILIILALAAISATSVFAQTPITVPFGSYLQNSAVYQATAGEFSSDSDNINSKDIFSLNKTFFSAGYVPQVVNGGQVMQAFWGMPIGNMYVAIAGAYQAGNRRVDSYTTPGGPNSIQGETVLTANGDIMFRPVFKLNDSMSFHYYLTRTGTRTKTVTRLTADVTAPNANKTTTTNITSGSQWTHEIAATIKFGEMYVYIPLGVSLNNNILGGNTTYDFNQVIAGANTTTGITNNNQYNVIINLNPEFWLPLTAGPMTGIMFKLGFDVAVYENRNDITTNTWQGHDAIWNNGTLNGAEKEVIESKNKSWHNIAFKAAVSPSFSWTLAKDMVALNMDPELGVEVSSQSEGYIDTKKSKTTVNWADGTTTETTVANNNAKTTETTVTPYISVPIGTLVSPTKWFQFRAGVSYSLSMELTTTEYDFTVTSLEGGKRSEFGYNLISEMGIFTGFGFIIGEDFFIDLYLTASGTTTPSANQLNLFNLQAWGMQLTYRF